MATPAQAVETDLPAGMDFLFDAGPRIVLAAYLAWVGAVKAISLVRLVHTAGPAIWSWSAVLRLVPTVGAMLFSFVMGAFVLIRHRRVARLPGIYPTVIALTGGFLVSAVGWLPHRATVSVRIDLLSAILMVVGSILGIIVLRWLGRSFSILPEARRLVTTGPYRLVRHPLYISEGFLLVGVFVQYAPPWCYLIIAAQVALQLERMRLEERVLTLAFPEYTAYAARTARIIPGIY